MQLWKGDTQILAILSCTSLITSSIEIIRGYSILFAEDILGDSAGPFPRHSKQYTDLFRSRDDAVYESEGLQ